MKRLISIVIFLNIILLQGNNAYFIHEKHLGSDTPKLILVQFEDGESENYFPEEA